MTVQAGLQAMKLQDLKAKKPNELLEFAEDLEVENASSMRKQDMMFAILKELAERNVEITGDGVLEILQDGFGFLRSAEGSYLAGPDDIYVSPSQIRRFNLRTGDTIRPRWPLPIGAMMSMIRLVMFSSALISRSRRKS